MAAGGVERHRFISRYAGDHPPPEAIVTALTHIMRNAATTNTTAALAHALLAKPLQHHSPNGSEACPKLERPAAPCTLPSRPGRAVADSVISDALHSPTPTCRDEHDEEDYRRPGQPHRFPSEGRQHQSQNERPAHP